jgi:hypothetical protein
MGKLRYGGATGKYSKYTLKEMKELMKKYNIAGRSYLKRRFDMIHALEAYDRRNRSPKKSPK